MKTEQYSEPIYGTRNIDDRVTNQYYQPKREVPDTCYCPVCGAFYPNNKGLSCFIQRCKKCKSYLTSEPL